MGDGQGNLLENLIKLSRIDSRIARIRAERVRTEDQLAAKEKELKSLQQDSEGKTDTFKQNQESYRREEKYLAGEQQKLVDRRKALTTLSSYKLQLAAEKEIEAAAKALSTQEENLIKLLVDIEDMETAANTAQEAYDAAKKEFDELEEESQKDFTAFQEQTDECLKDREELVPLIERKELSTYNRIVERNPTNPVVPLVNHSCSGCQLQLGPQIVVQIGRAESLVRCRGCGRILYLGESEEE